MGPSPYPHQHGAERQEQASPRQAVPSATGIYGTEPPDLLREIIRRVQELTGTTIREQAPEDDLTTNQWRPEIDIGGCLTGHIEVLVENEIQARRFQESLANLSLEVHQRTIPLLVTGDSLVAGTFRRS